MALIRSVFLNPKDVTTVFVFKSIQVNFLIRFLNIIRVYRDTVFYLDSFNLQISDLFLSTLKEFVMVLMYMDSFSLFSYESYKAFIKGDNLVIDQH